MNLEKQKKVLFVFLCFIVFSVGGWIWELLLEFLAKGEIANHGFLHGPWLPIYGCGGLLIYFLINRFKKYPLIVFMGSFVFCTVIEYSTAYILETYMHHKWWSYSHMPFNIDGRICLLFSIAFGITGIIGVYLIFPYIKKLVEKLDMHRTALFCLIFFSLFAIDLVYSFNKPNIVKYYKIIDIQNLNINFQKK